MVRYPIMLDNLPIHVSVKYSEFMISIYISCLMCGYYRRGGRRMRL